MYNVRTDGADTGEEGDNSGTVGEGTHETPFESLDHREVVCEVNRLVDTLPDVRSEVLQSEPYSGGLSLARNPAALELIQDD